MESRSFGGVAHTDDNETLLQEVGPQIVLRTRRSSSAKPVSTGNAPKLSAALRSPLRQLHSGEDSASFDRVKGRLVKAVKSLRASEQEPARNVVAQWAKARGALMNRMLQTIVCEMAVPPVAQDRKDVPPFSYANIVAQKLILRFNYGDTVHFSEDEEANLSSCGK